MAEGPFEDDEGVGAHFDRVALSGYPPSKAVAATKVDYHTSIVKLARHCELHKPRLIFGEGQGAMIAAAYAKPLCLEHALQTRNVQRKEAHILAQAWGNVALVLIHEPRMSRKALSLDKIKIAMPELFATDFPISDRRVIALKDQKSAHYISTKEFYHELKVAVADSVADVSLDHLIQHPPLLMWEHNGVCSCGKRTFLFGQCPKCLAEEEAAQAIDRIEASREINELGGEPLPDLSRSVPDPVVGALAAVIKFALPDALPRVPVATGLVTGTTLFVTDLCLHTMLEVHDGHL